MRNGNKCDGIFFSLVNKISQWSDLLLVCTFSAISVNFGRVPFSSSNCLLHEVSVLKGQTLPPILAVANVNVNGVTSIYMLSAGWEVRIVKNCDRGHTIRTDPKPVNLTYLFSPLSQITFIVADLFHTDTHI